MKLGSETGNVFSHIQTESKQQEPKLNMGVTMCFWTDRKPGTIVKLTSKRMVVQEDKATRTDTNGVSENQTYTYETDPDGFKHNFSLRKNGKWKGTHNGAGLIIGYREYYHDYSF